MEDGANEGGSAKVYASKRRPENLQNACCLPEQTLISKNDKEPLHEAIYNVRHQTWPIVLPVNARSQRFGSENTKLASVDVWQRHEIRCSMLKLLPAAHKVEPAGNLILQYETMCPASQGR